MKSSTDLLATLSCILLFSACDIEESSTPSPRSPAVGDSSGATSPPAGSGILASAVLSPASGSIVRGTVNFLQDGNGIRIEASVTGLSPGQHGFHIHEKGDCSASDASSAGGHFNPANGQHAGPSEPGRHLGDLGNLEADSSGNARYSQSFPDLKLDGDSSVIGRAVIVHAKADDLKTQPAGNSGDRVACGVIEKQ